MLTWLWLPLLGCPAPEPSDMDHYLASVASESGGDAHRSCLLIEDKELRGECVSSNAGRQARLGHAERAFSFCDAIAGEDTWQEECVFLVLDIVQPPLEEAIVRCPELGAFSAHCLLHVYSREVSAWQPPASVTDEQGLYTWLQGELERRWHAHPVSRHQRLHTKEALPIVTAEVGRRLAGRLEDGFTREDCGNAPFDACAEAYRYWMHHRIGDAQRLELCERKPTSRSFEGVGLPAYDENVSDEIGVAYRTICRSPVVPKKGLPSEFGWEAQPI